MADPTQNGTGGFTLGTPTALAEEYITVPAGAVVVNVDEEQDPEADHEDVTTGEGAFHSSLWFERRKDAATVVIRGKAYTKRKGDMDGNGSAYEVMAVSVRRVKTLLETTIKVRKIVF